MFLIVPFLWMLIRMCIWVCKLTVFLMVIVPWLLYCSLTHRRHGVYVNWWLRI